MSVIASDAEGPSASPISLSLTSSVNSLLAAKKAALKFSDSCAFDFTQEDNEIVVLLTPRVQLSQVELEAIANDYKVEFLDQELREVVASETESVRNLILANVFSKVVAKEASD